MTQKTDVRTREEFHSHPSGTNGGAYFIQGPSQQDFNNAVGKRGTPMNNYVFARGSRSMGGKRVYIFSTNGVKAFISHEAWKKTY